MALPLHRILIICTKKRQILHRLQTRKDIWSRRPHPPQHCGFLQFLLTPLPLTTRSFLPPPLIEKGYIFVWSFNHRFFIETGYCRYTIIEFCTCAVIEYCRYAITEPCRYTIYSEVWKINIDKKVFINAKSHFCICALTHSISIIHFKSLSARQKQNASSVGIFSSS